MHGQLKNEIIHLLESLLGKTKASIKHFSHTKFMNFVCELYNLNPTFETFTLILNTRYNNPKFDILKVPNIEGLNINEVFTAYRDLFFEMCENKNKLNILIEDLMKIEESYIQFLQSLYQKTDDAFVKDLLFHENITSIRSYKSYISQFRKSYVPYILNKNNLVKKYTSTIFKDDYIESESNFMRPVFHLFSYIKFFTEMKRICFKDVKRYKFLEQCFRDIIKMANNQMIDNSKERLRFQQNYERDADRKHASKSSNVFYDSDKVKSKQSKNENKKNFTKNIQRDDVKQNLQQKCVDDEKYGAMIEFGDLSFLITFKSLNCTDFKRLIICRIAKYFYPDKEIKAKNIELAHYRDFNFFIKYNNKLFVLEADNDLNGAVMFMKERICVVIKSENESYDSIIS